MGSRRQLEGPGVVEARAVAAAAAEHDHPIAALVPDGVRTPPGLRCGPARGRRAELLPRHRAGRGAGDPHVVQAHVTVQPADQEGAVPIRVGGHRRGLASERDAHRIRGRHVVPGAATLRVEGELPRVGEVEPGVHGAREGPRTESAEHGHDTVVGDDGRGLVPGGERCRRGDAAPERVPVEREMQRDRVAVGGHAQAATEHHQPPGGVVERPHRNEAGLGHRAGHVEAIPAAGAVEGGEGPRLRWGETTRRLQAAVQDDPVEAVVIGGDVAGTRRRAGGRAAGWRELLPRHRGEIERPGVGQIAAGGGPANDPHAVAAGVVGHRVGRPDRRQGARRGSGAAIAVRRPATASTRRCDRCRRDRRRRRADRGPGRSRRPPPGVATEPSHTTWRRRAGSTSRSRHPGPTRRCAWWCRSTPRRRAADHRPNPTPPRSSGWVAAQALVRARACRLLPATVTFVGRQVEGPSVAEMGDPGLGSASEHDESPGFRIERTTRREPPFREVAGSENRPTFGGLRRVTGERHVDQGEDDEQRRQHRGDGVYPRRGGVMVVKGAHGALSIRVFVLDRLEIPCPPRGDLRFAAPALRAGG